MSDKRLLPQANSLETVIRVFIYCSALDDDSIVDLNDLAHFCYFEPRQASYYVNACNYLGLVDKSGVLTPVGRYIINNYPTPQIGVYERIMSDPVISKIFSHMVLFPEEDIIGYVINYLQPLYPEYGSAVIRRRASTLKSWCEVVIEYLQNKK